MKNKLFFYAKKFFFLTPVILYFGERSLIAYDEGIYALQAKWIIKNNNWITPMKWGAVVDDRTIGIQFLIALSQKLFGENLFAIYIPSIIFGLLMIFLTYELHKELTDKPMAIISPLILSTTYLWINYFHMATQDLIFASLTTLGIYASVKSHKKGNIIFFILAGVWIGLSVMLKTYLVIIPLLTIFPFLWKTKIIRNFYFWLGLFIGFIPFSIWSIQIILINGWQTYSGLYSKLLSLSENNVFTNPFYYYLWNFSVNTLPWSIFLFIGLFQASKTKDKTTHFFLFKYPLIILFLLSLFSTKTPYYPLQIVSLTSINAFLGIDYIFTKRNELIKILNKIIFLLIPTLFLISLIYIGINKTTIGVDSNQYILINLCISIFSISWLSAYFTKNIKDKFILVMIGPYLMCATLVQAGIFNDRAKEIRIEAQKVIYKENLKNRKVEIITDGLSNENATKRIIKLALFMPNLGNGISNIKDLNINEYAWASIPKNTSIDEEMYEIIYDSDNLYPWKLITKKY